MTPKAERKLESIYPLHREKNGGQAKEKVTNISSRLAIISRLWPEAPKCTDIFCKLLIERILYMSSISVARFNAEAFELIVESIENESEKSVHSNPHIVTADMARIMLRALPKLNKIAFGERTGASARKYGHELLKNILDFSRKARKADNS